MSGLSPESGPAAAVVEPPVLRDRAALTALKPPASPPFGQPVAWLLILVAGLAAGAVFLPAVLDQTFSPRYFLPGAVAGGLLFAALWLAISKLLGGRCGLSATELGRRLSIWFAPAMLPLISYFPYLLYRSGLQGDGTELPPLDSRPSAVLLFIWSLMLLFVLLRLAVSPGRSRLATFLVSHARAVLAGMIVSWIAAFFTLDVLKDQYMHVTLINSAVFSEAMLNVTDPRGFMFSHVALAQGASIMGAHSNYIFLLIVPVFRLWPDYHLLLFVSDLALALSAWPAYLLAKRHFSTGVSLLLAGMFLLSPIITAQPGRSDISELRFVPLFFLTAFYLFEKKRFGWFALAALALLSIREDLGIFVALFGIYAIIRRYPLKWILAPLAAGGGWFLLAIAYVLPHLSPTGTAVRSTVRYSSLGSSGTEIAKTLFFRPWKAFQVALSTPSHIGAAYGLLLSFGALIPLLSGAVIFAIPAIAELLFQEQTTFVNFMAVPAAASFIVAFFYGLSRVDRLVSSRWNVARGRTALVLAAVLFFVGSSSFHAWFNPGLYQPRYNYDEALTAFNMVPADAKVRLPEYMLAFGTRGQTVSGFHQAVYQEEETGTFTVDDDYLLVDEHIPARTEDSRFYQGLQDITAYLQASPDFHKVYEQNDIALYVRNGHQTVGT